MINVFGVPVEEDVTTHEALRAHRNAPSRYVANKVIDHVDALSRRFIAASSMVILATRRSDGSIDQTPRGDPAGFVQVLSDTVLALPDRPGNNRADAFENILQDPGIGLMFLVPGHNETLRVSGKARIVSDRSLCAAMAVRGHIPDLAILVKVERVLSHCPKAFVRGHVWAPDHWTDTEDLPTAGEFLVTHGQLPDTVKNVDAVVDRDGQTRLY